VEKEKPCLLRNNLCAVALAGLRKSLIVESKENFILRTTEKRQFEQSTGVLVVYCFNGDNSDQGVFSREVEYSTELA